MPGWPAVGPQAIRGQEATGVSLADVTLCPWMGAAVRAQRGQEMPSTVSGWTLPLELRILCPIPHSAALPWLDLWKR